MSQTPEEVTTHAYHWILQRQDGVGFATTSHDRPHAIGAMTMSPDMDLRPGELFLSDRLEGSYLSLNGGVSSPALAEDDLLAGRWDGAALRFLASDWASTTAPTPICEGEFGTVRLEKGRLAMSVDLLPAAGRQPPCIQTSPECRATLGDWQCRIDMRSRRYRVQVVAVGPDGLTIDHGDTARFVMGNLRWVSGPNCGLDQLIISGEGASVTLQADPRLKAEVGHRAIVTEGCNGQRSTCSQRFNNIENFRGEPDLPGSEILMRFPGA